MHPFDGDLGVVRDAAVAQGFGDGQVGVMKLDVLAHQGDGRLVFQALGAGDQLLPLGEVRVLAADLELAADQPGQSFLLKHQRHLVQLRRVQVGDDCVLVHVAEQADLILEAVLYFLFGAQDNDVRLNADAAQLLDRVLGGFGLELAGLAQVGQQGDVDIEHVFRTQVALKLPDGLQVGQALNIAHRTADFGDDHVRVGCALRHAQDAFLDLIGDVRDNLYGTAQVITPAFLGDDIPIDLAGGHVAVLAQAFIGKTLVVAEVEVGLCAVIGHEDLAVLVRAHGTRIIIEVGVKFLNGHLQASGLEQTPQGCTGDPLSK